MPKAKKNATFLAWLQEMRDEEDSDSNKYMILNKAFGSLKQETKEYPDPDSLITVKFIGPKIVSDLKMRWKAAGGGAIIAGDASPNPSPEIKCKRSSGFESTSEPKARGRPRKHLFEPGTDDEDEFPQQKRHNTFTYNGEAQFHSFQADEPPPQHPFGGHQEAHQPQAYTANFGHIPMTPIDSHASYGYPSEAHRQSLIPVHSSTAQPPGGLQQAFKFSYIDGNGSQILDCHRALIDIKDGAMWYKIGFFHNPVIMHPLRNRIRLDEKLHMNGIVLAWVRDEDVEEFGYRSAPGISFLDASFNINMVTQPSGTGAQILDHPLAHDSAKETLNKSARKTQEASLKDLLKAENKPKRNTVDPTRALGIQKEWDFRKDCLVSGPDTGLVKKKEHRTLQGVSSQAAIRERAVMAAIARQQLSAASAGSFVSQSSGSSTNPTPSRGNTLPSYSSDSIYASSIPKSTFIPPVPPPAPEGLRRAVAAPVGPPAAGLALNSKAKPKGRRHGRASDFAPGLPAVDEFDMDLDKQAASQRAHAERITSTSVSHVSADLIDDVTDLTIAKAQPFEPFDPIIFPPSSFEICLVLDNREVKSQKHRDYIATELRAKGVNVMQRSLPLGDVLWIARSLMPATGTDIAECVLDYILERKRLDDLCSSIKDGRFREQKFRLANTGLQVFYLIEDFDLEKNRDNFGVQIDTARSSTQMVDGFIVKETKKLSYTIDFLATMHRTIKEEYQNEPLYMIPPHAVKRHSYMALQKTLREDLPTVRYLTSYASFEKLNNKSGNMTTRDLFAHMLLCVKGVSSEKASSIIEKYPTVRSLWDAFQLAEMKESEEQETEKNEAIATIEQGLKGKGKRKKKSVLPQPKALLCNSEANGRQRIGPVLGSNIYRLMRANSYKESEGA